MSTDQQHTPSQARPASVERAEAEGTGVGDAAPDDPIRRRLWDRIRTAWIGPARGDGASGIAAVAFGVLTVWSLVRASMGQTPEVSSISGLATFGLAILFGAEFLDPHRHRLVLGVRITGAVLTLVAIALQLGLN